MACDDCRDEIYFSDGTQNAVQAVSWGNCPTLRSIHCCPFSSPRGELWHGFALESFAAQPVGTSCATAPCPTCSGLQLGSIGDAAIGNTEFGFRIDQGPSGSVAIVLLQAGACTPIPILCGQFFPAQNPIALLPFALSGTATCNGSGSLKTGIPLDTSLCNGQLCVQGLVICLTAPVGLALTNGLTVPIGH
jgi:hypothetical protein